MSCFTKEQLEKISNLVKEIEQLSDIEKLLLYLQLPCGQIESSEGGKLKSNGKNNLDLLSKKPDQETTQTYTWILSHLEEDPTVSLPKQEVYDEYKAFCQANGIEPLCVADFGKAMKHAFPCIKPRRLGQRGNSKYCYSGLRKKYKIQPPSLPDLLDSHSISYCSDSSFMHSQLQLQHQQQQNHQQQQQQQSQAQNHFNPALETCSPTPTTRNINNHATQQLTGPALPQATNHLLPISGAEPNQRQRVNYSCCEAMNLKIELPEQHHHLKQQHQPLAHNHHHHSTVSPCDDIGNGPYATIQHQLEHKLENNNDTMAQDNAGAHQASAMATDPQGPLDGPPASSNNLMNQLDLQHQQLPMANYGSSSSSSASTVAAGSQIGRSDYEYLGASQRFGTPDDDDYKHNYQDLNRPIVGEFSYLTPQQEQDQQHQSAIGGVFLYDPAQGSNLNVAQNHHPQSIHHNPLHLSDNNQQSQHHHLVPSSPSAKQTTAALHASRLRLNLNLPLANNSCSINSAVTSATTPMTNSPTQHPQQHPLLSNNSNSNGHSHSNDQNHHHHNQYQANDGRSSNNSSDSNHNNSLNSHPHLQHLHLSNICNNGSFNNGISCYDSRLNSSSIDCCASPFQSPASTPYPMMSNFSSQDVTNYYSNDCIGYSDQ